MTRRRYDVLVIGSGIAGLFYARQVAEARPNVRIAVITKKAESDTNTNRAQGGIAAVVAGTDSFSAHVEDTLRTGSGLCHEDVVERVVRSGPAVIDELVHYGVRFTETEGTYDLGREGGHSANRVLHAADLTGREIERALLRACRELPDNIEVFRNHIAIDLITSIVDGIKVCSGANVFSEDENAFQPFIAPVTLLATGGLAQVYFHNTNPRIATGDGVAIAYRAGVPVANLEFVQFHPTVMYSPGRWPFLISEAVRGEGARLKSMDGRFIMENEHELKDLAPRDVVARAVDKELKNSGEEYVLLDISHRERKFIRKRFPNINRECLRRGFDIAEVPIPVVPGAHYSCGGVLAEINGRTALPGLYVSGEVAMTGMHGANRLASNSLLEAVVMAKLAVSDSVAYLNDVGVGELFEYDELSHIARVSPSNRVLISHDRRELCRIMSDFVGIVRSRERLELAMERILDLKLSADHHYEKTPANYNVIELRNMATVAELIVRCALQRHESRGLHFIEDYPDLLDKIGMDTVITGSVEERRSIETAS
jgi:L-aspartate oxidase